MTTSFAAFQSKQFSKKDFNSNHSSDILKKLNSNRKSNNEGCDVTICVGSHSFPVHKCVVSAFSLYFENLFKAEMSEKYENKVEMKGVSVDIMETIVSFIYTSEITITSYNVFQLLAVADYMQLPYIKEYCRTFLFETLNTQNCFNIRTYAIECNDQQLIGRANRFISNKFGSICNEEGFIALQFEELLNILQLSKKKASEEIVYRAIIDWIEYDDVTRKEHLTELFKCVKLDLLPNEFLQEVVAKQPYVMSSLECSNLIVHTLLEQHKPKADVTPPVSPQPNLQQPRFEQVPQASADVSAQNSSKGNKKTRSRAKKKTGQSFVILGGSASAKNVVKYDVNSKKTTGMPNMNVGRYGAAAVIRQKQIYVMGGQTNKAETLNLQGNSGWMGMKNMDESRQYLSAAVLNDYIHVCGGTVQSLSQTSVQQYDHNRDEWLHAADMLFSRSGHALVSCNDALYAIGGSYSTHGLQTGMNDTIEMLDARRGTWSRFASMLCTMTTPAAIYADNKIYCIGGRDPTGVAQSVVCRMDIRNKTWEYVSEMNEARHGHCACVVGNKIYVFGGSKSIEAYDLTTNSWSIEGEMTPLRNYGCVVTL